ncbi:Ulp1 protease family, C-terminal catalytic domain containing protein [Trema orientale]|uniref:Ulp1 protease family, C-terminal catalytic domain containing protein n=1 Tax=Trema orientale TaxID=63057 RepID=A0A2P5BDP8_TREOI|nr:Ulp1 protease family, C-terminal catalytic domain containing protein [Trema orientale]
MLAVWVGVFGNEKLSSRDVKFDNSKGIDIDRNSVLLESNKSILKSRLLTAGNVDLHTGSSNYSYDKIDSFKPRSGINSCILKSEIIEEQSKWKEKLPQVEVVSAMKPPKFGGSPQFISVGSKETDCLYIGSSGTGLVESRIGRCTRNTSRNASLDVSLTSKTCEKKRGRSKSSSSCSKMSGSNGQVMKYRVGPFKLTRKLNTPRDGEVLEYIFDESLPMSEYIVETVRNHIQRGMILCLKPGGNVWGEVINVVSEILTEFETNMHHEERKNWFLSTRDMFNIIILEKNEAVEVSKMKPEIFIPIHQKVIGHWLLFVVFVEDSLVQIWDSFLRSGELTGRSVVDEVLINLDIYLAPDIAKYKQTRWSFTKFRIETNRDVPQQKNCNDCGIYVINFLEQGDWSLLRHSNYHSESDRARVAVNIVLSDQNQNKERLCRDAKVYYWEKFTSCNVNNGGFDPRYQKYKFEA